MSQQETREAFSRRKVVELREQLAKAGLPPGCAVVVNGSFARLDASEHSDVDFFVVHDKTHDASALQEHAKEAVLAAIAGAKLQPPNPTGAFGEVEAIDDMMKNVGGTNDPNEKLTRRMLLMLEGDWLTNEPLFHAVRQRLIQDVYIRELDNHNLARFFLNDVVRYWRTLGVDFAYKTTEKASPWGLRMIKLLFSRKLIYFGGILMVAETDQLSNEQKIARLVALTGMTPVERIRQVCGAKADDVLARYEHFQERIADGEFRAMAKATIVDPATHHADFKAMKQAGKEFSQLLDKLLKETYGPDHPIHHALVY